MVSPYATFLLVCFLGSLSDVTSRKRVLLLCLFVCCCAYFWLGIASSLYVLLSLRIVLGIFKQTQILTRALAPEYIHEPNQVSILYGKLISLGSFGQTLGSFIGGYTIENFPRSGFTLLCGLLSIFFGINAALINSLPETKTKDEKDEDKPDSYAVSFALARIVTLAMVMSRSAPNNQGTLIGALYSASSLASIITPIIGGLIIQYLVLWRVPTLRFLPEAATRDATVLAPTSRLSLFHL
ncbi:hypothetical protein HF086_016614 [Spodoptera exigua]|uniref:Major facilitator superfamily (MFS) profile domain-containing protein n=1 Tax=Spodoptera exigua TaxID=7107 RepID=A0A922MDA8_SPOEX|nr:hypothetical protein HF086_016614 [Spodoptera exigua]